ncbi:glutamine amidotransferase [Rhizobium sp. KVB221]|uniref:Glutamine amidotransferase n=1 Tax=Rhizobium setariae TaxID=2801340 RepID=A0A936YSJ9_9HYPH|nr:glutamine amidotransferase [Rhizobium setariae]MBL0374057.1 glutamine amidotransferase [Rhizobium setariae]
MLRSALKTKKVDSRPILIVLHQENSTPGRAGQMLEARGYRLDIRRPFLGQKLPDTMRNHSGAVIFGGPMSANDPDDYVKREIDWISVPLSENRPFLGICLGAQMLVKNLGGKVESHTEGMTEIGWYPLESTEEGRKIMDWPSMVYHFHREGFDLPSGAKLLARGHTYENQAFRFGENAWAVQFHGELTRAMMHRWVVHGAHRFELPNAQTGDRHLDGRFLHDAALRQWMSNMIDTVFGHRMVDLG